MYIGIGITNILLSIYALSDIYNILSYGRVKTYIDLEKKYSESSSNNPAHLTVLSGDFLSPHKYIGTNESNWIIKSLDSVPVNLASFGNHEFDLEHEKLNQTIGLGTKTRFVSTNINRIANTVGYHLYQDIPNNFSIGFIGICGNDFYQKYPIEFVPDEQVNLTIDWIIDNYKPDYMVGLTHMEIEQDIKYTEIFPQLDLILGGHIHTSNLTESNGIHILRTGENADFVYRIDFYSNKTFYFDLIDISTYPVDPEINKLFLEAEKEFDKEKNIVLFEFKSTYLVENPRIRIESLPKLICQMVTNYTNSDITILNSGIFKLKGRFIGNFTKGMVGELLPFEDSIVTVQMESNDLVMGIEYAERTHWGKGGFIQTDLNISSNIDLINKINVSTTKLLLEGVDPNPFFTKYSGSYKKDSGTLLHDIISSYRGMVF